MGVCHSQPYRYCHLCHLYESISILHAVRVMPNEQKNIIPGYESITIYEPEIRKTHYSAHYDRPFKKKKDYKPKGNKLFLCENCFVLKNNYEKWKIQSESLTASKRIKRERNVFKSNNNRPIKNKLPIQEMKKVAMIKVLTKVS